jgi:outer membrane biosynthesis protein TonB
VKRLLALVAGGLGLRALLRRRSRFGSSPSPAEDLRAKLAQTKTQETTTQETEPQETQPEETQPKASEPAPLAAPEPEPAQPEPAPEQEPAQPETVEGRRSDVHAKARQAIDDLRNT